MLQPVLPRRRGWVRRNRGDRDMGRPPRGRVSRFWMGQALDRLPGGAPW